VLRSCRYVQGVPDDLTAVAGQGGHGATKVSAPEGELAASTNDLSGIMQLTALYVANASVDPDGFNHATCTSSTLYIDHTTIHLKQSNAFTSKLPYVHHLATLHDEVHVVSSLRQPLREE